MLLAPASPTSELGNGSDYGGGLPRARLNSINSVLGMPLPLTASPASEGREGRDAKEGKEAANVGAVWKQVMDPVLDYCQVRAPSIRVSFDWMPRIG